VSELITASRLSAFRRCPRYHALSYDQRVEPTTAPVQYRWGTAMHRALEAWWIAARDGDADGMHARAIEALESVPDLDPYDRARAIASLAGYHARWSNAGLRVLAVEIEFEAPLVNPDSLAASRTFRVAGKIDAIAEDADGRIWIVEHKTSSDDIAAGSPYWQRLRLDAQISIYLDGARAIGFEPAGCLYDVIGKPGQKPLMATPVEARKYTKAGTLYANQREADETPDEFGARVGELIAADPSGYYQRGIVVRTGDEMTDARREIWDSARLLRFAQREGCQIRNPSACAPFRGAVCTFFDLCSGAAEIDGIRYRIRESAHPELAAANQGPKEEGNAA